MAAFRIAEAPASPRSPPPCLATPGVVRDDVAGPQAPGQAGRRSPPLARRLLLLVAAVALPLVGLAAWAAWSTHEGVRARAEEALLNRARAIALAIERDFDRAAAVLDVLAASGALARADLGTFEEEMRAASATFGGAPVTLVSADGTIALSTLWPPGERRSGIRAPGVALRVMAEGRTQVANLFRAPLTGALSVAVGVPILAGPAGDDDDGPHVVRGGIGLSLTRDRIAAALRTVSGLSEADAGAGRVAAILDRGGVSVARTGREEGVVGHPARAETLSRLASRGEGIIAGLATRDGTPAVTAFTRGARSGYTYLLAMPAAEFAAPLRAGLARTLGLGALVLAAGLGLAALLARRTVAAFRAASDASHAPVPTGLREADELAQALAGAAAERERAEDALREANRRNAEVLASIGEPLCSLDPDGSVVFASARALAFWGKPPEQVLGHRFDDVFPHAVGSAAWEAKQRAAARGEEIHLCTVSPLAHRWIEMNVYPRADGGITVAFRDVEQRRRDHIERARAEAALRASEERLRLAQEAGGIGAWELDRVSGLRHWSESNHRLWGVEPGTPITLDLILSLIHPADRERASAAVAEAAAMVGPLPELEFRIVRRSDGAVRWLLSRAEGIGDGHGRQVRQIGIMRDITEQKEAMERLALLMRELDHRAKNALAVVSAALRLTRADDPRAFVRAVEGRVGALARAHTMLAEGRWEGAGLRALIEAELAAFLPAAGGSAGRVGAEVQPRVDVEGPALTLAPGAAQALSMALHELATNATKYGALSAPAGRVGISWRTDTDAGLLRLRWEESGGPPVTAPPSRRGFGSRLVEATVEDQLGGRLVRRWAASGLVCDVEVPLPRVLARSGA